MTLGTRELIVALAMSAVLVLANALAISAWLAATGVISLARFIRREYLTGTAITIIVVLLILLLPPAGQLIKPCRVCPRLLLGPAKYCGR